MSARRTRTRFILSVLVGLVVLAACKYAALGRYHDRAPEEAGVGRIVYSKTKTFGFGPGGNETGVIIFKLSQKSSIALQGDPDRFLASFPKSSEQCRNYIDWQETPLIADETNISGTVKGAPITLEAFLNRYGFGIPVSEKYGIIMDAALAQSGSYIARSRCGSFIFIPKEKLAAYIFVG